MSKKELHQFTEAAIVGDATTDQAFLIRQWLREMGFSSEIYSEHCQKPLRDEIRPASSYKKSASQSLLIYHHAIGASVVERLFNLGLPLILIYHNITPPAFFAATDPTTANLLEKGQAQLGELIAITHLALGDSSYNEAELREIGYRDTGVLPIILDEDQYNIPCNEKLVAKFNNIAPILLFLGRMAPNKKQEDLVKLLYYYRRIEPDARLILVGSTVHKSYVRWLEEFIAGLGLSDNVVIAGHVTMEDMVTYYQIADLYISMSEHEGFGKPLVESMYFQVPVMAYSSTAVPYTMADSGVLFCRKEYEYLAELADLLIKDRELKNKIIEGQNRRIKTFLTPQVKQSWIAYLQQLHLIN